VGAVSFSIDIKLVEQLKQVLPLTTFVETGTFEGATIQQVIGQFEEIHSVELSPEYYSKACDRFREASVKLYNNSSERFLQEIGSTLRDRSVLYWLDAHWCVADGTAGEGSQCPLLEELNAIQTLNAQSVILIDDARLFLCTPPKPHNVNQWPTFNAILRKLYSLSSSHEVMVINDVMVYYPESLSSVIQQYAHHHSIDWLYVLQQHQSNQEMYSQLVEKEAVIQEKEAALQSLFKENHDHLLTIEQQRRAIEQVKQDETAVVQKLRQTAQKRQQQVHQQSEELNRLKLAPKSLREKLENKLRKVLYGLNKRLR
jgi:vacuolar-type H+-ATPase subunit I/STV1